MKKIMKKIIEIEEEVTISQEDGSKVILEKGDKIKVMSPLEEDMNVSVSINYAGVDGSFTIDKRMDFVMPEEGDGEPQEVENCYLNGNLSFNIHCGNTMPDISAVEEAVKAFVNKFAAEKVE